MKTKHISLLLLPLLVSCGSSSYDSDSVGRTALKDMENLSVVTSHKTYTVEANGNVLQFNSFNNTDSTFDVPTWTDTSPLTGDSKTTAEEEQFTNMGSSFLLHLPVRLSYVNFYSEEVDQNRIYAFNTIESILNANADKLNHLSYSFDDGYKFINNKVSKELNFYNIDVGNGPKKKAVKVYARFEVSVKYDKDGFVVEESVKTSNAESNNKESVDVKVTYTYKDE